MKTTGRTGRIALAALVATAAAACGRSTDVTVDAQPAPPPGAAVIAGDAAVVDMFTTANNGEVEAARLALTRASDARVRQFAQRMITDHTRANERAMAVMPGTRPAGASTNAAARLRDSTRETLNALRTYEGAAFDRAYMESQIDMHQYVLDSLDDALIPAARDRDVAAVLRETRPAIAEHLRIAREILSSLPR